MFRPSSHPQDMHPQVSAIGICNMHPQHSPANMHLLSASARHWSMPHGQANLHPQHAAPGALGGEGGKIGCCRHGLRKPQPFMCCTFATGFRLRANKFCVQGIAVCIRNMPLQSFCYIEKVWCARDSSMHPQHALAQ